MNLFEYFNGKSGLGILATASSSGEVDAAIYSIPHVMDDGTVAFIMRDRLTHNNLGSNPHAAFLFVETPSHFKGIRLFLEKTKEDRDENLIRQMTRRHLSPEEDKAHGDKFLVYFKVKKIVNLIGGETPDIATE